MERRKVERKVDGIRSKRELRTDGGKGSGNFGHSGRPGKVGGSQENLSGGIKASTGGHSPSDKPPKKDKISHPNNTGTTGIKDWDSTLGAKGYAPTGGQFAFSYNGTRCHAAHVEGLVGGKGERFIHQGDKNYDIYAISNNGDDQYRFVAVPTYKK